MEYTVIEKKNENTFVAQKNGKKYILKRINQSETELIDKLFEIKSENIVKFIEYYVFEDGLFVVLEYIEGTTIEQRIENGKIYSSNEVVEICCRICKGLSKIHRLEIVHRDITPSNIIIASDETVKIIDFGISRTVKSGATKDTTLLGTRGFAAPEQFGFNRTTAESDIYSLGRLMNYMLTGGKTTTEMLATGKLLPIIKKSTDIDSKRRFKSCEELIDALQNSNSASFEKVIKKQNRIILALCVLVVLLVSAFVVFALKQGVMTEKEPDIKSDLSINLTENTDPDIKSDSSINPTENTDYEMGKIITKKWKSGDNYCVRMIVPIKNTGNENLVLRTDALATLDDENGNFIAAPKMIDCVPRVIMPGETGYYTASELLTFDEAKFDLNASFVPSIEFVDKCERFEITRERFSNSEYGDSLKLGGKIKNSSRSDCDDVYISFVVFDENGGVLTIGSETRLSTLPAGVSTGFEIEPVFAFPTKTENIKSYKVYAYSWNV